MSRIRFPAALAAAVVLTLAACGESPMEPEAPALARGGPSQLPTSNGRIYFHGYMTGNYDLYSINPDGTDLRRLTFTAENETWPRISPDGKQIVYLKRAAGGDPEFWVMNADGSRPRLRLAKPDYVLNLYAATWSPDGRALTFSFQEEGTLGMRIASMAAKSGAPEVLAAQGWKPSWSPDGQYLAYEKGSPNGPQLVTSRPDGTGLTEHPTGLSSCCGIPQWSADGLRILVAGQYNGVYSLRLADLEGSWSHPFLTHEPQSDAALSPDGLRIVYASAGGALRIVLATGGEGTAILTGASGLGGFSWSR